MRTRLTGYGRLLSEALKGWRKDLEKMSVAQVRTVFGLVEGLGLVEGAKRPGKDVCCTGAHALAQVRMRLHVHKSYGRVHAWLHGCMRERARG